MGFATPFNYSSLVNWNHPITVGLESWLKILPQWRGGVVWRDLTRRNDFDLNNMGSENWSGPGQRPWAYGKLDFNGTNEYGDGGDFSLAEDGHFTYSLWVFLDVSGGNQWMIAEGSTSSNTPLAGIRSQTTNFTNRPEAFWRNDAGSTTVTVNAGTSGPTLTSGWHHVVATGDGSTLRLYVDGVLIGSAGTFSGTLSLNTMAVGAAIRTSVGLYWNGKIDDVLLYRRGLLEGEVRFLYDYGRRVYPTVLNRVRMDETGEDAGAPAVVIPQSLDRIETGFWPQDLHPIETGV
jgi:hypothetical protein